MQQEGSKSELNHSVDEKMPQGQHEHGVKRLQPVKQELQGGLEQRLRLDDSKHKDHDSNVSAPTQPSVKHPITIRLASERSAEKTASLIVKKEDPASEVSKLRASLKAVKEELGRDLDSKGPATAVATDATERLQSDNSREVTVKAPWRGLVKEEPGQDNKDKNKGSDRIRAAAAAAALANVPAKRPRTGDGSNALPSQPHRAARRSRSISRPVRRSPSQRDQRSNTATKSSTGDRTTPPQQKRVGSYVNAAYGVADLKYMDSGSDEDGTSHRKNRGKRRMDGRSGSEDGRSNKKSPRRSSRCRSTSRGRGAPKTSKQDAPRPRPTDGRKPQPRNALRI